MRRTIAFVTLALLALSPVAPAGGAEPPDVGNQVVSAGFHYFPGDDAVPVPTLTVVEGESLHYAANFDIVQHSVTDVQCEDEDADTPCRFDSGLKSFGQGGDVTGVPDLAPGSYQFTCILHLQMRGTLVVQGV